MPTLVIMQRGQLGSLVHGSDNDLTKTVLVLPICMRRATMSFQHQNTIFRSLSFTVYWGYKSRLRVEISDDIHRLTVVTVWSPPSQHHGMSFTEASSKLDKRGQALTLYTSRPERQKPKRSLLHYGFSQALHVPIRQYSSPLFLRMGAQ